MIHRFGSLSLLLAIAAVTPAPARAQEDATSHFDRGTSLYRQQKWAEAEAQFEESRRAAPNDPLIYNWIGFVRLVQGKYADAIPPLEQAVRLRPNYPEAYVNLGNA